jgi:hypothetical protein
MTLEPQLAGNRGAHRVFVIDDEDARLAVGEWQGHVEELQ